MVLKLRVEAPDQWKDAKCLGVKTATVEEDYDPFFPSTPEEETDAKEFCNGEADGVVCPVRSGCLMFALTNNEKHGIWGGMDEIGRRALRKKWPLKGKLPHDDWQWYTTEDALNLLTAEEKENIWCEELSPEDD